MAGLSFFSKLNDREELWAREWSPALVKEFRQKKVTSIVIDGWYDKVHSIESWIECADQITQLRMTTPLPDMSFISRLYNLEDLTLHFSARYSTDALQLENILEQVDFSKLKRLRSCLLSDVKSLGSLTSCPALEELALHGVPLKDFTSLTPLKSLRVLGVYGFRLESLHGIGQLPALRTLVFADVGLKSLDGADELMQRFEPVDVKSLGKLTRKGIRFDIDEIEAKKREETPTANGASAHYVTPVSPDQPGCILFLVDQSGSMGHDGDDPPQVSKARAVSDAINRFLRNLAIRCIEDGKVRDYWHVGVIGYGDAATSAFQGALSCRGIVPISEIASSPLHYINSSAGTSTTAQLKQWKTPFPIWLQPKNKGDTKFSRALVLARKELEHWIAKHPSSFPPLVVNLTDEWNAYTGGRSSDEAWALQRLATTDGNVLFFQLAGVTAQNGWKDFFNFLTLRNHQDEMLRITSTLPPCMRIAAQDVGYNVTVESREFVLRPSLDYMLDALDIFTAVPGFEAARQHARLAVHQRPPHSAKPSAKAQSAESEEPPEYAAEKTFREFVFQKGTSNKFWKIALTGKTHTIQFGRQGTIGRTQTKTFASSEAALGVYERLIAEKLGKGYVEVTATPALALSREQFWKLIAKSRQGVEDCDEQVDRLVELLTPLTEQRLFAFQRHYETCRNEAYRWDLWGVAYLIQGGCSDDGFIDFIGWLIGQGQKYFEAALTDPANVGKRPRPGDSIECESMAYVASMAYEAKTKKGDFHDRYEVLFPGEWPEIKGESWAGDDELEELYPTLARKFRQ